MLHLEGVPRDGLVALEESSRFKALFAIWDASTGQSVSHTMPIVQNHVRVILKPFLRVWVNRQEIQFSHGTQLTLLLTYLLEHNFAASFDEIEAALCKPTNKRRNGQSISTWKQKINDRLATAKTSMLLCCIWKVYHAMV